MKNNSVTDYQLQTTHNGTQPPLTFLYRRMLRKVPEVTIYFWIIKLLTTAMGEVTSDFLVNHVNPVFAVGLSGLGLLLALALQFWVRKYIPWIYWLAAIMVAIFGTMGADVLHVGFGVPYSISSLFFAATLCSVFAIWYLTEKTLSIHSINTTRREVFYWATIMATFALGTALGDLTASTFGLGYFTSGVLFTVLFALPAIAYWLFKLNSILAFWLAYILTRPLGASFADWMGKERIHGGLGWGTGLVSIVLTVLIIVLVTYVSLTGKDSQEVLV